MNSLKITSFKTQFDDSLRYPSEIGNPIKQNYTSQYDDNGVLQIIPDGKENLYEFIQSHKDSCDIHVIMKRYKNGEIQDLQRVHGIYGDFTKAPKTYAEMLNIVHQGEELFEKLPLEIRERFGHDSNRFISSFDSPLFYESLKDAGLLSQVDFGSGTGSSAAGKVSVTSVSSEEVVKNES